ncbi:MAG: LysR family transcriptional regulator [Pseudolabrys sp.]
MRIFVAVAESGSFVAGAKAMGLTRSAAGKALARLENHLGTRLVNRTTRRLSLTAHGHEFYHRCLQIIEDLQDAEASVLQHRPRPRGILRLTASEGYGKAKIIPYLREFLEAAPDLAIEMSFSDRIVDLVEEGFDLAIRVGAASAGAQYVTQVIDRACPCFCASPDYLERRGRPDSLVDLERHQRLIYGLGTAATTWSCADRQGRSVHIDGKTYTRFDSGDGIRVAAIAGLGIGLLPSFMVERDLHEGTLVEVLPEERAASIAVHAIYPSRRHLSIRVRSFIDGLRRYLG